MLLWELLRLISCHRRWSPTNSAFAARDMTAVGRYVPGRGRADSNPPGTRNYKEYLDDRSITVRSSSSRRMDASSDSFFASMIEPLLNSAEQKGWAPISRKVSYPFSPSAESDRRKKHGLL